MLQDQRVISTSAVRCVGNTLILQGRVYSPPYVITAIGDVRAHAPDARTPTLVTIYRQYVDAVGLGYDVRTTVRQQTCPRTPEPRPRARASRPVRLAAPGPRRARRAVDHARAWCCCSSSAGSCGGPTSPPTPSQAAHRGRPSSGDFGARGADAGAAAAQERASARPAFRKGARSRSCGSPGSARTTPGRCSRAPSRDILDRRASGTTPGRAMPGAVGNFAVAGHRTTYGRPFHDIDRLRHGDPSSSRPDELRRLRGGPARHRHARPTSRSSRPVPRAPRAKPTERWMTMTACHPKYSASQRYVVFAQPGAHHPARRGPARVVPAPRRRAA